MEGFDAGLCCKMSLAFNRSSCLQVLESKAPGCDLGDIQEVTSSLPSTTCYPRNMSLDIDGRCDEWYEQLVLAANKENLYDSVLLLVFLVINQLVGLLGNALVVVVYISKKHKTMTNHFMLILGTIDLLSCLFLHPYIIHKVIRFYNPDTIACKVFEFLIHFTLSLQGNVMLVIAVDRFNAVCRPLLFLNTPRWNSKILSVLFAISFFGSTPVLKFYGHRHLPATVQDQRVLLPVCHYTDEYDGSADQGIFGMTVLVCLLVSIIAMVVLYSRVSYTVFKRRQSIAPTLSSVSTVMQPRDTRPITDPYLLTAMKEKHSATHPIDQPGPSTSGNSGSDHLPQKNMNGSPKCDSPPDKNSHAPQKPQAAWVDPQKADKKAAVSFSVSSAVDAQNQTNFPRARAISAAKMLFLVTAVFFLSWLPFWVIKIRAMVVGGDMLKEPVYQKLLSHMFYTNNAINPFIYTFMNKNFINDISSFWRHCVFNNQG